MQLPIKLNKWVDTKYKSSLNKIFIVGNIIALISCISVSVVLQHQNNHSIIKAFTDSFKTWTLNGDLLRLKQTSGHLVSSNIVNFVSVYDADNTLILKVGPDFYAQIDNSVNDISFHSSRIISTSCEITVPPNGRFCFKKELDSSWILLLSLILIGILSVLVYLISVKSRQLSNELANQLLHIQKHINNSGEEESLSEIYEVREIVSEFNSSLQKISESNKKIERFKSKEKLTAIATQLSHDIRSPLAALEMISGSLNELPEDKRLIIRNSINRIRDISNSLLHRNRLEKTPNPSDNLNEATSGTEEISNTLLGPLIDSIITEKRLQYRNQIGIRIDFNQTKNSYGLFANIQPNEFQRVLSNLIDNSVEAFSNLQGTIELFLQTNKDNKIDLVIKDNGKGIPENILPKLGTRGETHGKENGSGLGLFHAKETIQAFNGSLQIYSKLNAGTAITLTLPTQKSPNWFVPKISLTKNQTLIVFDDDQSIHQIWKGRLESLANSQSIQLRHFSDPSELRKFYGKNFTDLDSALFLMDYEITGSQESGLDVIETLGIQKQSILVTSRYEERSIRDRCESLGVPLIPKNMSGFVPMEIIS